MSKYIYDMDVQLADESACILFGIKHPDIRRQKRQQNMVEARQMIWKILKEIKGFRVCELARLYERDHNAICSGIKRIGLKVGYDKRLESKYKLFKSRMKQC
jgi:chromosomal replication initiation ATPase DnaA